MNQSIWQCIFVILIAYCLCVMDAEWIQSDVILPPGVDDAAVGFYDDQFYIFGGGEYKRQLIRYNSSFTVIGTNELPHDLHGNSQFYRQHQNTLYMIHDDTFTVYNFETKLFQNNWMNLVIPDSFTNEGKQHSCLVITDQYLFVVGGSSGSTAQGIKRVHILNLSTQSWTLSHMNRKRTVLSCAVDTVRNKVYAISGRHTDTFWESVEVLNITNIDTKPQSWTLLDDTLTEGVEGTRALFYEQRNVIYVIGGSNDGLDEKDTVHIINTITDAVELSPDRLPYLLMSTAAIRVKNVLYCFGGWNDAVKDTWIYYVIPTDAPTNQPTNLPTTTPTHIPTTSPTNIPTMMPTNNPTNIPTTSPTNITTMIPTKHPTTTPTNIPTTQPFNDPTIVPTNNPTNDTLSLMSTDHDTMSSFANTVALVSNEQSLFTLAIVLVGAIVVVVLCIFMISVKLKKQAEHVKPNNEVHDASKHKQFTQPRLHIKKQVNDHMNIMNKNDENNIVRNVDLSTGTKGANRVYNVAAVMAGSVIMTQGQRNDDISQEKASQKMISDTTEGSNVYNVAAVMKGSVIMTRGQKAQSEKHSETYEAEGAKREELVTTFGAAENAVTVVDHIEENDNGNRCTVYR